MERGGMVNIKRKGKKVAVKGKKKMQKVSVTERDKSRIQIVGK